jgi:tetratricopeptide (TPR) repeat protein
VLAIPWARASTAQAGEMKVVSTWREGDAQAYLGSEHRKVLNEIAASQPTPAEGLRRLQPVLAWCDSKVSDEEVTYLSVENDAAAKDFQAEHPRAPNLTLIDAVCPGSYKLAAFYSVDADNLSAALTYLDQAIAIAPYFDEAWSERGFIFNQQHQSAAAADTYRRALALLARHPDDARKAVALRGLGFALVESGDLSEARKNYEASLLIDPGSKLARDELEYISTEQRKQGPKRPAAVADAPKVAPAAVSLGGQQAIRLTRELESAPLGDQARLSRGWLIDWEAKTSEVDILVCDTTGLFSGKQSKFTGELVIQGMFGNAAWQLEHPGDKGNELALQLAGLRSTLKSYAAILREQPRERLPTLDALATLDASGGLETHLAPIVAEKCRRDGAIDRKNN